MNDVPAWTRWMPAGLRARIAASPELQRVLPNTGWLAMDRVLRMALAVLVGAWIARYLGPSDYGTLNFAFAWVALFTPLAALAHERLVVRELVGRPQDAARVLGSAAALRLLGGAIGCIAAIAGVALLRPGDAVARTLVAILSLILLVQPLGMGELWYQARVRTRDAMLALTAAALLTAALRAALILAGAPLPAFAGAGVAEALFAGLAVAIVFGLRERGVGRWRVAAAECRALVRDSWPLVLSAAMILVYMRIDMVMLRQMTTEAELGAYAAAVKLVEGWYFIPTAVVASLFPSIVEARQRDEALFLRRLQRLYGVMAAAGYVVAIPTCILAPWLVRLLYGSGYDAAAPMLAVLIWSLLFTNLGVARGAFLASMNWTRPYLLTVALGGVINVVLNLLLIPRWGAMGAVIASLVAYWVATHGSCLLYPPLRPTARMIGRALVRPWA